jgi:PST family polysaccharide transporter
MCVLWLHGTVVIALGKPSWMLGLRACLTVLRVAAFVVAARWGLVAVSTAVVACQLVSIPGYVWLTRRLIRIRAADYFEQFRAPVLGTLAALPVLIGAGFVARPAAPILRLAVYGLAFGGVYVAVVYVLDPRFVREAWRTGVSALTGRGSVAEKEGDGQDNLAEPV